MQLDVVAAAGSFDFAQDFASRLGRLLSGSSSNPSGPAKVWNAADLGRVSRMVSAVSREPEARAKSLATEPLK